jgi:6-phosphogluconolactonase
MPPRIYVGTFPEGPTANDAKAGPHIFALSATPDGPVDVFDLGVPYLDAAYLAAHPDGRTIYSVNRTARSGGVAAWSVDIATGDLKVVDVLDTGGGEPCHLSLSRNAKVLFVANYVGGSVASFLLAPDGGIRGQADLVTHHGKGPRSERQQSAHPHMVLSDPLTGHLLVPDLGCDQVLVYAVNEETGRLQARPDLTVTFPPGAGPRHAAFFPDGTAALVVNELDSTVAFLDRDGDGFRITDLVKTVPDGVLSHPSAVRTSPDGSLVYVANRGHDTISSLRRQPGGRTLTLVSAVPCGGRPRDVVVDREMQRLLVANHQNRTVTSMPIGEDGIPSRVDLHWTVPNPSCLVVSNCTPAWLEP